MVAREVARSSLSVVRVALEVDSVVGSQEEAFRSEMLNYGLTERSRR